MSSDRVNKFVLVGAPNSGKTTLYNWLTGSNYKTVNYPGSTVEYSIGGISEKIVSSAIVNDENKDLSFADKKKVISEFEFIDTPGTYSLIPKSLDEKVTFKILYNQTENINLKKNISAENSQDSINYLQKTEINQTVLLVIDGVHLERSLILALQLKEAGIPFHVVITMDDLIQKQGVILDIQKLSEVISAQIFKFNGQTGAGLKELVNGLYQNPLNKYQNPKILDWSFLEFQNHKIKTHEIYNQSVNRSQAKNIFLLTKKIDRVLLGPLGFLIFIMIMGLLFSSLFWFSSPFSDGIEAVFAYLGKLVETKIGDTLVGQFISQGVLASFSAILVFVPQIFLLFMGLSILESTGYLSRAATLIDHPLKKMGLGGRSFVPLLSGYACAVPALMATRNIASKRERWITLFITPLMSCSARLPVYGLLLSFLFPESPLVKGFVMGFIYILAFITGIIASYILTKILKPSQDNYFMMDLPLYRSPKWFQLLKQSLQKTKSYVLKAGPIIFVFAVILWASAQFPRTADNKTPELEQSYAGKAGHVMEPFFRPMGVDWRVGVGLISAFAAREVFVSAIAVTFKVTEEGDAQQESLIKVMNQATFSDGEKIFTLGSIVGLIIFFMIALQCMSTVAVQIRESGSIKFAMIQLISLNVIGYILAVISKSVLG